MAQFPNTTAADGIWTLKKVRRAILGDNWPEVIVADEFFANTVLLLQADDFSDGSQNNTFLDSSTNAHTIARNGNVTQGSFSPFSQDEGKWGNYFDGNDGLLTDQTSDLAMGTSDFTFEAWIYANAVNGLRTISDVRNSYGSEAMSFQTSDGVLQFWAGDYSSSTPVASSSGIGVNQWHHVAFTRSSGTNYLFIDGTQVATNTTSFNQTLDATIDFSIGYTIGSGRYWDGYISNFRIVKGTAVYTSNFTPPTEPLTAISGTSLLTCQSNRFVDNSSNAHSITVNGDPEVTPFSPFAPSTVYDPATKGGSGYFDGSVDGLDFPTVGISAFDFPSGTDFTLESWIYPISGRSMIVTTCGNTTNDGGIVLLTNTSYQLTAFSYVGNFTILTGSSVVPFNQWSHVAFTREGSTARLFLNGVLEATATNSTSFDPNTGSGGIGHFPTNPDFSHNGYISDVRIVKGTAVYTSAFTPPTAPLTAVSGTSLLCNFTNAGIYDGTGRNVLETVGDAQVDTAVAKYGTGSMQFDGNGDYLEAKSNLEQYQFGTGDFTVECWVNKSGQGTNGYDGVAKLGTGGAASDGWYLEVSTNRGIYFTIAGGTVIYGTWTNDSAWHHIAVTRDSGTVRIFLDGTVVQTGSLATSVPTTGTSFFVGDNFTGNHYYFNGYIDDLRITKGVARYTANFTPPAAKLEQQ